MEKTATLNIRIEPNIKSDAEKVLSQLGVPMSTAITMFLKQVSITGGIPFSISLPSTYSMSASELHEELRKGYEDIEKGNTFDVDTVIKEFAENRGV